MQDDDDEIKSLKSKDKWYVKDENLEIEFKDKHDIKEALKQFDVVLELKQ